jgi:hypothetical protein
MLSGQTKKASKVDAVRANANPNAVDPVAKYVQKLSRSVEEHASTKRLQKVWMGQGKTHFELANEIPNQSTVTKVFPFNFRGTAADFDAGKGITSTAKVSLDHGAQAKLLLLNSKMTVCKSNTPFDVSFQMHGQPTNTEFITAANVGKQIGSRNGDSGAVEEAPDAYHSTIIPGETYTSIKVNFPIYDRKKGIDFEELNNWIGFQQSNLERDILAFEKEDDICIIRHSMDAPSPIVVVLESSVDTQEYEPFELELCTHEGQDACILGSSAVKFALDHIQAAWDMTEFTDFSQIKATISPETENGRWTPDSKALAGKNGAKNKVFVGSELADLLEQGSTYSIKAFVECTYVVCNKVQDNISAINQMLGV